MMRTWIGKVFIATSLDGFIARENGDIEWLIAPPSDAGHIPPAADPPAEFLYPGHIATVDHIVMGRGSYEKVLTFADWPYPDHHVIVISTTLAGKVADARVSVVGSVEAALAELERRQAKGVYVDGGQVIQEFVRRDLIDEITLTRAPVLLGSGLSLFGVLPADVHLRHMGTIAIESGMTTSRYLVNRSLAG